MSLAEQLAQQLDQLPCPSSGELTARAAQGREVALVELQALDRLGVLARRVRVRSLRLAGAPSQVIAQLAQMLAQRICYLLEPLRVLECDQQQGAAQVRSWPPYQQQRSRFYYELWVRRGGELELVRWEAPQGQPRRQVPFQLTREVLLRVVGDFQQALAEIASEAVS